ncbi:MAG: uncharacterized metal-binding protein YceD (DUF177 family) [Myxococcota bacterium]|jgi:uncharacterized metal-binding protein YceD (DUF177 family)
MRVRVDHIDDRDQQVTAGMGDVWAVTAASDVLETALTDLSTTLDLRRAHGHVFVTGAVRAAASRNCERCGESTSLVVDTDVELSYVPRGRQISDAPESELKSDQLDVGWYADGHIDLADTLREALALALPPRVVCEDEPACEERTRTLLSGAPESSGQSVFSALRNWTDT